MADKRKRKPRSPNGQKCKEYQLEISTDDNCYSETQYSKPRKTTWEYAYRKTCILVDWLAEEGAAFYDKPKREDIGTSRAYALFKDVCEAASNWHKETGAICEKMMHEKLKGLEGCKVWAIDSEGTQYKFYVGVRCNYCPFYFMAGYAGSLFGRRVKDNITDVERIKNSEPLPNNKIVITRKP